MIKNKGFTLLEVLIAITIVGMALGAVFGLLAGSKRLAFKAADDIERTIFLRSALNAAQILEDPDYPELPNRYKKSLEIDSGDFLEKPEKQTRPMKLALESYVLHDDERDIELVTVRLVLTDTEK